LDPKERKPLWSLSCSHQLGCCKYLVFVSNFTSNKNGNYWLTNISAR